MGIGVATMECDNGTTVVLKNLNWPSGQVFGGFCDCCQTTYLLKGTRLHSFINNAKKVHREQAKIEI